MKCQYWNKAPGIDKIHQLIQTFDFRTVSTAQFLPGSNPHQIVSAGTDRYCRLWDLRNLRSALFAVRTDASINRLAISGPGLFQSNNSTSGFSEAGNAGVIVAAAGTSAGSVAPGSTSIPQTSLSVSAGGVNDSLVMPYVLALPLDNRTLRLIASNGSRIGRIPRNITHVSGTV